VSVGARQGDRDDSDEGERLADEVSGVNTIESARRIKIGSVAEQVTNVK